MRSAVTLACAVLAATAVLSSASDVVKLTSSSFNKVTGSGGVWIVEFFAPWCGHCKALAPEYEKAATALRGVVNVAAVDATVEQSLASQHGVRGYPTIKIFGADKRSPTDYNGARTAEGIVDAGLSAVKSLAKARLSGKASKSSSSRKSKKADSGGGSQSDVVPLSDDNFDRLVMQGEDEWLVEFYAPWCGHCKALAPEWEQAATELKGKVKVGAVDATVHTGLAQRFGIQGFPTIKLFPAGKGKTDAVAQDYQGARTASAIADFAMSKLEETASPPRVVQVVSQQSYEEACPERGICVLAFLPHILDSGKSGREEYLGMLQQVAAQRRRDPFTFVWLEGGSQPTLEKTLRMGFGFPALVAVSRSKSVYAIHSGAFEARPISEFLTGLTTGSVRTVALDELPPLRTVEPWDGEEPAPVEEEFSLEEIMGS